MLHFHPRNPDPNCPENAGSGSTLIGCGSAAVTKHRGLNIQGGSDKSGIFFFLLSNDTAQLIIIRFD
jgi:hypothetical protein